MDIEPIDDVTRFAFWRDGCREFAKNLRTVLDLANPNASPDDILRFIRTLPRIGSDLESPEWKVSYCYDCLKKAFGSAPEAARYFFDYFTERSYAAQIMLIDGFVGFITGLDEAEPKNTKGELDGQRGDCEPKIDT